MAGSNDPIVQYLDIAYDVVDGSPEKPFARNEVENKLGMDEQVKRQTLRDLENRGMVSHEGASSYRLTLPAIHQVEEVRMGEGRAGEVDPRREERGTYVRTLHELAGGQPGAGVALQDVQAELGFEDNVERRTREYLIAAGLADDVGDQEIAISEMGAEWAEGN